MFIGKNRLFIQINYLDIIILTKGSKEMREGNMSLIGLTDFAFVRLIESACEQ